MCLIGQLVEQAVPDNHQTLMHRIRLVQAEEIDVGVEGSDVRDAVRSERHAVNDHSCANAVGQPSDLGDVVFLTNDV